MSSRILKPTRGRILIRREKAETVSAGGLYLPGNEGKKEQVGEVVGVYTSYIEPSTGRIIECEFNPGDYVLFGKYSGNDVEWGGETLLLLGESEVLAKVVPGAEPVG